MTALLGALVFTLANAQTGVLTKLVNVDLQSYDCLLTSVAATKGKCSVTFLVNAVIQEFVASPEVAAIYANPTVYAHAPFNHLILYVSGREVIQIEDAAGERVSKKIDYSR